MLPVVALATCRALPEPDPDEALTVAALERAGLEVRLVAWDDPGARLDGAARVILRSTWNYHGQLQAFLAWAEGVGERLINPPHVVRWNAHKRYLLELESRGVRTVPTVFVDRGGSPEELLARVAERGFTDLVVKPAVSAGSFGTRRFQAGAVDRGFVAGLLAERDVMVQPYVRSVEGHGERAIVAIDGELTHAVRKSPRFATDVESVSTALPIAADERALAERALAVIGERLTYARVDVVQDEAGAPMVGELELIEPSLFFRHSPAALERFVAAVLRRL